MLKSGQQLHSRVGRSGQYSSGAVRTSKGSAAINGKPAEMLMHCVIHMIQCALKYNPSTKIHKGQEHKQRNQRKRMKCIRSHYGMCLHVVGDMCFCVCKCARAASKTILHMLRQVFSGVGVIGQGLRGPHLLIKRLLIPGGWQTHAVNVMAALFCPTAACVVKWPMESRETPFCWDPRNVKVQGICKKMSHKRCMRAHIVSFIRTVATGVQLGWTQEIFRQSICKLVCKYGIINAYLKCSWTFTQSMNIVRSRICSSCGRQTVEYETTVPLLYTYRNLR